MPAEKTAPTSGSTEEYATVFLRSEPVELYKILKFEGLAGSGAEAKMLIDDGLVQVNGEDEFRRRRKIVNDDCIRFDGQLYRIVTDVTD